uniref:Ubiquinone biosynthesis protein n=1 Tax=Strigomonas oncopelti TaxID=5657 RepID=T1YSU1_STROO|nr:ubiquinone biosynthesis protein [Strigomonas oncopelti]
MPHFFRKLSRYSAYTFGAVAAGTTAIVAPPKEMLPQGLLPSRVLLEGLGRVGRCIVASGQIFADYTYNLHGVEDQDAWNEVHTRCAQRLVTLAETNGGLYVKAGQIFANMGHILPYQYCHEMTVLQDAVVKRPYSEVVAVLERDLHHPLHEIFTRIDPEPIAAASLAQVHLGHLRKEDVDVAIKVQYIDIAQRFKGDMRTIDTMLSIAGYLYPGFDLGVIVTKLNDTVAAELDFRLEAHNNDRAAADLKKGGFGSRVVCPGIYWDYVTPRVMVSKFVQNAVKISNREGIERLGLNVAEVATAFIDAISYELFTTGFFHGDPHAGNVLVHKQPNGKPQVVLLDFGLCAEMEHPMRREMSDIWTASVTHDSDLLQQISRRYNCEDYELFASCFLQHPYVYYSAKGGRLTDKKVQESMRDTVKHKMADVNGIVSSLPKQYALVLRSIMATKAINRELGDVVNRPLRMLRYSLRTSHEDASRFKVDYMLAKAWVSEVYSAVMLQFAKWRHPELIELMENTLQLSG